MKTTVLLLVVSMAVLVSANAETERLNRNKMMYLVKEWIETNKGKDNQTWVEHVRKDPRDKFFCKVQNILESQTDTRVKEIGKSLKKFNQDNCLNCAMRLQNVTTTPPETVKLERVMEMLWNKMQHENLFAKPTKLPCKKSA